MRRRPSQRRQDPPRKPLLDEPDAPPASTWSRSDGDVNPVSTSTLACGAAARISGRASMPSISGIDRSSSTRSGCSAVATSMASRPSFAWPTTRKPGVRSRRIVTNAESRQHRRRRRSDIRCPQRCAISPSYEPRPHQHGTRNQTQLDQDQAPARVDQDEPPSGSPPRAMMRRARPSQSGHELVGALVGVPNCSPTRREALTRPSRWRPRGASSSGTLRGRRPLARSRRSRQPQREDTAGAGRARDQAQ